jgi:hypothetical protein
MPRRLAPVVLLLILLAGCDRYRSRAQGPFARQPVPPNPTLAQGSPPVQPQPQPYAVNNPMPPGPPAEASPVPPRPPEPAPVAAAAPPPAEQDPAVVPAGGVPPETDAGLGRLRPLRRPQPPTPGATPPAPPTPEAKAPGAAVPNNLAAMKKLAQAADEKWKAMPNYEARLVRREMIDGKASKTEEVVIRFRKEPMSVYMRNVGEAGKGREVLYYPTKFGDKMHLATGVGDGAPLVGWRTTISPDDPRVKAKSRHSIRDAGFGKVVTGFAGLVAKVESGKLPAGTLKYGGRVKRDEYGDHPLEGVEQAIRLRDEDAFPGGGVRHWFFDAKPDSPSFGLPILTVVYDSAGREQEYYQLSQVRTRVNFTDADFDPARLGKKK